MDCLSEDKLADLASGHLAGEELTQARFHISGCPRCRMIAAELVRVTPGSGASVTQSSAPPVPLPERGTTFGRYVVLEPLGTGGMGVVCAAYDPQLDRRVALKLLRQNVHEASEQYSDRLLREAQLLARLSHPNVVAVHDVGTLGDRVFIAMELLPGGTLAQWQKSPRKPRDVLAMYVEAGAGLAAAHAQGLVHRDFKPQNVLLGGDGRPRVTDFGLARALVTPETSELAPASSPAGASHLTQAGAILGTPAYMAPEQLLGKPADARSDQFSFCVALYEALHGARPFAGSTLTELRAPLLEGKATAPKVKADVPAAVARALERGLSLDPAQRYPAMGDLLADLEKDPARLRRRVLASTGVVFAVLLAAAAAREWTVRQRAVCLGGQAKWTGIWDADRRAQARQAFAATGKSYAADAFEATARELDAAVGRWTGMYREACQATQAGEQSEAMLEARMGCLDQRLKDARALTDIVIHADAKVLERAPQAAHGLADLDACADREALAARVQPPRDAAQRARVDALRTRLAVERAQLKTFQVKDLVGPAAAVAAEARDAGYRPAEADALFLLGQIQDIGGDTQAGYATLREAALMAYASREDELASRAWTALTLIAGDRLDKYDQAQEWKEDAAAALDRLGENEAGRARLMSTWGNVLDRAGRFAEAKAEHERALEIRRRIFGPDSFDAVESLTNLGNVETDMGQYAQAQAALEQVLGIRERQLGKTAPLVADALHGLAILYSSEGRYPDAVSVGRRALDIREAALGPDHYKTSSSLNELGIALRHLGQLDEAERMFVRAHQIAVKAFGPESPRIAASLINLGDVHVDERKLDQARSEYERALALDEKTGPENPLLADPLEGLAEVDRLQGKYPAALASHGRTLAIMEKASGPQYALLAGPLTGMGECYLAIHQPADALPRLERALALRESNPCGAAELAHTRFTLARALRELRKDEARALRLAEAARDGYATAGAAGAQEGAAVKAWLAAAGRR